MNQAARTCSVEDAARILGIGRGLAYELAGRGELPALRLGKRLVIPLDALERMLNGTRPRDDKRISERSPSCEYPRQARP